MKVKKVALIRFPTVICISFILSLMTTSCDNEWPDDTTNIEKNDSVGGIEVILNGWQDPNTQNIPL